MVLLGWDSDVEAGERGLSGEKALARLEREMEVDRSGQQKVQGPAFWVP